MEGPGSSEDGPLSVWSHRAQQPDLCGYRRYRLRPHQLRGSLRHCHQQVRHLAFILFFFMAHFDEVTHPSTGGKWLMNLMIVKCWWGYHDVTVCLLLSRWSEFTEFPQERSSLNLISIGGSMYAIGGFARVPTETSEVPIPKEMTDIWRWDLNMYNSIAVIHSSKHFINLLFGG